MVKVRSKLKRHGKGKTWSKGHSSTSNPEQMKHRLKATSRFLQPNLKIEPSQTEKNGSNTLTIQALAKHEQQNAFKDDSATINDVAQSLKSFSLHGEDDDNMSETHQSTFNTFATNYTTCSNMSFKKLLINFRINSELHKEMLAILTALTEIIKERGGTESTTEYFLLLMEQIEASTEDKEITAGIALLAMGIKAVPVAVLRKKFTETAQTLITCLQKFMESSSNQSIMKHVMCSLSVLLRAQELNTWTFSSTWQYIDALLAFTVHSKPKIRRAAQHAVIAIINGSCFMCPPKTTSTDDDPAALNDDSNYKLLTLHPASNRVTKFCLNQFKPECLANQPTIILHTLTLLRGVITGLKSDDIRTVCEHLLSIMTTSNVLIRTNSLQVLYSLFSSRTRNLNAVVCAKLLTAIHEYRPDNTDVNQTLAWLTVLKEGHIHLAKLDLTLCLNSLPRLINVCIESLWLKSPSTNVTSIAIPSCIKELLYDCVKPANANAELANLYNSQMRRIINDIHKMLNIPLEAIAKYAILTFAILFETCGKHFANDLKSPLLSLAQRYDVQNSLQVHIEHTITIAVKYLGVEMVLKVIPLTNSKNEIQMDRTWLLPLLREGTTGSTFKFFKDTILPLALDCNTKWHKYAKDEQSISLSHTYELLCCQLWGLFPGFCRQPQDPENFSLIAPTLGNALDNNLEFRAPIYDGFIELLQSADASPELNKLLIKYAKNFLPRLFNIYTQKPNGTYEQDLRTKTLEVIQMYLKNTSKDVLKELYDTACNQLHALSVGSFQHTAIYDIIAAMIPLQSSKIIEKFFENYMVPTLMEVKQSKQLATDELQMKKQQRQTYQLLRDILTSEMKSCQEFTQQNLSKLQKLLLDAFSTNCSTCQAARLRCLLILIDNLDLNHELVHKAIPEAIINYREFSTRKENVSTELLKRIIQMYHNENKLNDLVDILTAGFAGDDSLITNTIFAFRTVLQDVGTHLTVKTLEFILEQVAVFVVQKSRSQARASIAFLITFMRTMPSPFISNYLEIIMKSLSAMVKDTKRYCRIEIGYLLKKLCKRFTAEELNKYVPGDDEITHKRLKKIRKQLRRDNRKKQNELDKENNNDNELSSDEEFIGALEKKSVTIEDILADSDSDLLDDNDLEETVNNERKSKKTKQNPDIYIREDPEDENIVDFIDIKSVGNISTNKPNLLAANLKSNLKTKAKDINRGFKTAPDGRLIISDKDLRNTSDSDDDIDDDSAEEIGNKSKNYSGNRITNNGGEKQKRLMEEDDSSDDEDHYATYKKQKRTATDATSTLSQKTIRSRYTTGGKGIHRPLGPNTTGALSSEPSKTTRTQKSIKSLHAGSEYRAKKAKGDIKKKGKLDPYAYIPLSRSTLNKRKQAKRAGTFNNIVKAARKGALRGVKNKITKCYN